MLVSQTRVSKNIYPPAHSLQCSHSGLKADYQNPFQGSLTDSFTRIAGGKCRLRKAGKLRVARASHDGGEDAIGGMWNEAL